MLNECSQSHLHRTEPSRSNKASDQSGGWGPWMNLLRMSQILVVISLVNLSSGLGETSPSLTLTDRSSDRSKLMVFLLVPRHLDEESPASPSKG